MKKTNYIKIITTKIKNLFIIKYLIAMAAICFYTHSSEALVKENLITILRTLAIVDNKGRLGNGFFITNDLLITSYQVIKNDSLDQYYSSNEDTNRPINEEVTSRNILVRIASIAGEDVGQVLAIDPKNDLAIIKTAEHHYSRLTIGSEQNIVRGPNATVFFQNYNAITKTKFSIIGHNIAGFIGASIGNKLFHTTIPILPNTRGAPVFSKNGDVIGMISGRPIRIRSNSSREYNQYGDFISYTFAVSVNRLRDFIARHRNLLERESSADLSYIYPEFNTNDNLDMYIRTPEDQFRLSLVYRYGIGGVPRDDKKAFELLEKASRGGHTEAQYQRAKMHYFGIGTEQNHQKAFYWSNKAANGGHIKAKMLVGHMHGNGIGTPKDSKTGQEFLQKAIEQEDRLFGCNY